MEVEPAKTRKMQGDLGAQFRRRREANGYSVEDVSSFLRIRPDFIIAIEDSEFDRLPGRVYAIGFIRNYAQILNMDADKAIAMFKTQYDTKVKTPELVFPAVANDTQKPSGWMVSAGLISVVFIVAVWSVTYYAGTRDLNDIPPLPPELSERTEAQASPLSRISQSDVQSEAYVAEENTAEEDVVTPQEAATPLKLVITATEKSWIEIRNADDRVVLSKIMQPGEAYSVPEAAKDFRLTTGNAGGLEFTYGTEKFPSLGNSGEIRRNLPLEAGKLKEIL